MQKQRKIASYLRFIGFWSLCLLFCSSLQAYNPPKQSCGQSLVQHPASEIYSAHTKSSHKHEPSDHTTIKLNKNARLSILKKSSLASKYERILERAKSYPGLYKICLVVLSEFESTLFKPKHYEGWINFLNKSSSEELSHRIFEGIHVLMLSRLGNPKLAFEPEGGFFYDTQSRKTMDVEVRDPNTGRVLSYKEIKQSSRHENAKELIRSVIKKTLEIRPKIAPEVELSGVIFLGSEIAPEDLRGIEAGQKFLATSNSVRSYLKHRLEAHPELSLDSVVLVDLALEQYVKFYLIDGRYEESMGDYPIAEFLHLNTN